MTRWFRRRYGARPLHLVALLAAFGVAGYAVQSVFAAGQLPGFALWFAASVVAHDLLLFSLYTAADRSLQGRLRRRRLAAGARQAPSALNYVRVPAAFSLLLLFVWFPLILRLAARAYRQASGLTAAPYLWRWLAVTGAMFTASAFIYALRLRRAPRTPGRSAS